jgi:hypothetical protein
MRGEPLLHPVGPLPASVYWARRLAVLAAVVVFAGTAAVALAQTGPTSGVTAASTAAVPPGVPVEAAPDAPLATVPDVEPAPQEPPPDAEPTVCGPGELAVRVTADPLDGLVGVPVTFTVTASATGRACLVDVGPAAREAEVRSGPDRVWSSEDCEAGDDREVVAVGPGDPQELAVTWEGARSAPGCPPGRPAARPGTYTVVVTVDGVASRPATFRYI